MPAPRKTLARSNYIRAEHGKDRVTNVEVAVRDGNSKVDRNARFLVRPALYISILVGAVLVASTYKLRVDGIFACPADGYTPDQYLAYCAAARYGDYEHGAFWFGLEPSVLGIAARADAMFLGDSRTNFGFSTDSTARWFSAASARYYLLGFTYGENVSFIGELLRRSSLQARIYIIAVEFFERRETIPAKDVMQNPGSYFRYEVKRFWQRLHQTICGTVPAICRDRTAVYRSRQTGSYSLNLGRWTGGADNPPVFYDREIDQEKIKGYVASGREFLSRLPVSRDCIILTTIPTIRKNAYSYSPSVDTASAVANILGLSFVAPHDTTDPTWTARVPSAGRMLSFESLALRCRNVSVSRSLDAPGARLLARGGVRSRRIICRSPRLSWIGCRRCRISAEIFVPRSRFPIRGIASKSSPISPSTDSVFWKRSNSIKQSVDSGPWKYRAFRQSGLPFLRRPQ